MVVIDVHVYFGDELVNQYFGVIFLFFYMEIFVKYPLFCTRMKCSSYVSYQIHPYCLFIYLLFNPSPFLCYFKIFGCITFFGVFFGDLGVILNFNFSLGLYIVSDKRKILK